jgi:hypothetical protein
MSAGDLFWGVFGIVAWFALPAICLYFAVDGIRSGVVRVRMGSYSRSSDPGWFWACITTYGGFSLFVLYWTVQIAQETFR